jgi:hypothetical protein
MSKPPSVTQGCLASWSCPERVSSRGTMQPNILSRLRLADRQARSCRDADASAAGRPSLDGAYSAARLTVLTNWSLTQRRANSAPRLFAAQDCTPILQSGKYSAASLPPEILEPCRRQLGIAHRVLDILVTEVRLQRLRVVPPVCKRVPAGMTQHVRMCFK